MFEHGSFNKQPAHGDSSRMISEIESYLGRIASFDESTLSGDFGPLGDAIAIHEKMETVRWWLTTPFEDEIEEDEED